MSNKYPDEIKAIKVLEQAEELNPGLRSHCLWWLLSQGGYDSWVRAKVNRKGRMNYEQGTRGSCLL